MISRVSSVTFAVFAMSFVAGCGSENSVVGGRCQDGLLLIDDTCVAPGPGVTLATPTDPSGTFENTVPTSSAIGGIRPGTTVQPAAFAQDPPRPIDFTPPEHIAPPVEPPGPTPLVCASSLVECHGTCIAVADDGNNCGACGKICPSNICVAGECVGATPGDVVLIGHDFTNANGGSAPAKVLVNAVTIPTTDPIRVLSYETGASAAAVAQAKFVAEYGIYGRKVKFTKAADAGALADTTLSQHFDIVLIHEAGDDAAAMGNSWNASLDKFTRKGGVVVAIDRGTSPMPQLLSSSGLLTVGGHTLLPASTHLMVASASDVVGAQVLSPYATVGSPVSFQGLPAQTADLTWVVRSTSGGTVGDAVVVHRIVRDN